eukprot:GFUD01025062.1.p1 GENE.GFUD01025062.1~~GFUD01025062.1.p1  ORF type:complete len:187 (+),score=50.50 GFUD01025062.1:191-751(+)
MKSVLLLAMIVCCQANVIGQPAKPVCSCINPFSGTIQEFLGDKNITCQYERLCYVDCDSSCEDVQPAEGITAKEGRCISKLACLPVPDVPVVTDAPIYQFDLVVPVTDVPVVTDAPVDKDDPDHTGDQVETNAAHVTGHQIGQCMQRDPCTISSKCEVSCLADCGDLTSRGGQCFSDNACNGGLLF